MYEFDSKYITCWIDLRDWKLGVELQKASFSIQFLCFTFIYWRKNYRDEWF